MRLLFLLFFACGFIFANSFEQIKQNGVIRVGLYTDLAPFVEFKDGKYQGFEVGVIKRIIKKITSKDDFKIEFVQVKPADRLKSVTNNEVDILIANFTITKERAKEVEFSIPYLSVHLSMLTRKEDKIKSLADFKGKKVLVLKNSTPEIFAKSQNLDIVNCENSEICYTMLKNNEGDGYIDDNTLILAYVLKDPDMEDGIKVLGDTDYFGIAMPKGDKSLLDAINKSLIELSKEGYYKKEFNETFDPFYKGKADQKHFLLDNIYSIFG